jgi:hypothetical protein
MLVLSQIRPIFLLPIYVYDPMHKNMAILQMKYLWYVKIIGRTHTYIIIKATKKILRNQMLLLHTDVP